MDFYIDYDFLVVGCVFDEFFWVGCVYVDNCYGVFDFVFYVKIVFVGR